MRLLFWVKISYYYLFYFSIEADINYDNPEREKKIFSLLLFFLLTQEESDEILVILLISFYLPIIITFINVWMLNLLSVKIDQLEDDVLWSFIEIAQLEYLL